MTAAIAALWQQVAPEQIATARALESAAVRVLDAPADAEAWAEVRARSHRLAGTLGTFGQVEAGDLAIRLEQRVEGTTDPDAALRAQVASLARDLRRVLEASVAT